MKEFVLAAIPWVLCGIAVAIICAGLGNRKTKKKDAASEQRIALGMSLGLLLGVALNGAGLWENHGLGSGARRTVGHGAGCPLPGQGWFQCGLSGESVSPVPCLRACWPCSAAAD